jgi:hypothetical protein
MTKPLASKRAFAMSTMDIKNFIRSGTADTLVAPHGERSNQTALITPDEVNRFPR